MNSTEVINGFKSQQLKATHEKIKKQDIVLADLEAFKSQIEAYLTSEEARKHNQESSHIIAVKHRLELVEKDIKSQKAAEVDTLGDLVSFNKNDLMKFRNFGKKSLTELEELVNVKGLNFGMDLSKYKLDKD